MTRTFLFDTWRFFSANFTRIIFIVFPFTIPLEIFSFFYYESLNESERGLVAYIPDFLYVLLYPIFAAATVFFIDSVVNDRTITTTQAWGRALRNWASYLVLTVILIVVIGFGFALFILPGLFLAARLAFSEFDLLIKNESVEKSLGSSWKSTAEYFWVLLSGGLIISLIIYVPYFLLVAILSESGFYSEFLSPVFGVIESALMVLYTIYAFRVYDFSINKSEDRQNSAA